MTVDYSPLWSWIREREAIRIRREAGEPPPWTSDPILAGHRFCCVRREDDRVTRWIRDFVRRPYADHPRLWLALCLSRLVNWPDTLLELIEDGAAWPTHEDYDPARTTAVLRARAARGAKVYTAAYVIPAPHATGACKHAHVAEAVVGSLVKYLSIDDFQRTLDLAHGRLMHRPGWGAFLAYQVVVDARFCSSLLADAPDRETWSAAGPGTRRGLNRLHGRPLTARVTDDQARQEVLAIYRLLEAETGVAVDLSDVPNVLCETDKYLRVQLGQGRPRQKYDAGRSYAADRVSDERVARTLSQLPGVDAPPGWRDRAIAAVDEARSGEE